ncbi:MAG TPA: hypothetical protein VFR54_14735 [Xanthobacteraceae bacterium]|jgi:hypothetical protein|nr:hypothetical protein [Xanthobacteraceae bacterium]
MRTVRGPRVARTEDPSMDDERARGAAGAMADRAESAAQPQQLVLWSALRHDDEYEKSRSPRGLAKQAASKFLLIEPVGGTSEAPAREIKADHEIKPPHRDEFMDPQPTATALALWVQCALLVGALAVGLCLGWIGGSVSSRFFAAAPASAQQADASACAREGSCAAPKADREAAKIAGPRARIAARGAQQASANRDVATTSSIAAPERGKITPQLTPFPETRPTTIEGWAVREVTGSTVVLQGPGGVWRVSQGDSVPGVGRIDSIVRWGSRWIVATTRGLISTVD